MSNPIYNEYTRESLEHLLLTLSVPAINSQYPAPDWTPFVLSFVLLVGFIIAPLAAWENATERKPLILLLLIIGGAVAIGLLRVWWMSMAFFPARYLAIAFPALMLIMGMSYHFIATRLHWVMTFLPISVFVLMSFIAIYGSYAPLWQMPTRLSQLPETITPANITFENGLQVAGYTRNGDMVHLFWTTQSDLSEAFVSEVALYTEQGNYAAHCEVLLGNGMWSTAVWQPEEYVLQSVQLNNLSILENPTIEVRVFPINNQNFLDVIPDYAAEIPMQTDNRIFIAP